MPIIGIKTVKVDWKRDETGRWQMELVKGSEEVVCTIIMTITLAHLLFCAIVNVILIFFVQIFKCDMVMLAMGFLGPEKAVIAELELDQDARSNICTPSGKYCTNIPRVFTAGDCRRGNF